MDGEKGKLADSTAFLRDPNDVCEFIIPLLVLTVNIEKRYQIICGWSS